MKTDEGVTELADRDFDAIEAAVMETTRGRWFLQEFARRNRSADTEMLLEAIARLERAIPVDAAAPKPAGEETANAEIAATDDVAEAAPDGAGAAANAFDTIHNQLSALVAERKRAAEPVAEAPLADEPVEEHQPARQSPEELAAIETVVVVESDEEAGLDAEDVEFVEFEDEQPQIATTAEPEAALEIATETASDWQDEFDTGYRPRPDATMADLDRLSRADSAALFCIS